MEPSAWPVPPPFMWQCTRCTDLLQQVILHAITAAGSGSFAEQLTLARHIVADHPDDVPGPHGADCSLCTHYAKHGDVDLWEEHRARDLFMPARAARRM
ncbi:hypothetical protein [Streptomyces spiralis]|uniref:hypothetical protein n=1 Tax=Streptomyces spiralis TaxID=66376 RepID=UPI0036833BE3